VDRPAQPLACRFDGTVPYRVALERQHRARQSVLAGGQHELHLLSHPPTITVGRHGDPDHILAPEGCEVVSVDRGGDVTFHGPGQLVGYPIVHLGRLKLGVRAYVAALAEGLAEVLRDHAIEANWDVEVPGLWVGRAKIAAFGVHVHRQVTTHGFALNVHPDLGAFDRIVPCGLRDRTVTSMAALIERPPDIATLWPRVASAIENSLNSRLRRES